MKGQLIDYCRMEGEDEEICFSIGGKLTVKFDLK